LNLELVQENRQSKISYKINVKHKLWNLGKIGIKDIMKL